jgi:putative chitinase
MSSRQAYDYVTNAGGLRAMGDAWFGLEAEEVYAGPQYIEDAETTEQLASFVQKYGKDAMTGIKLADNRPMRSIQEMYGIDDHMESTESSRKELLTKEVFKEIFPKAKQSMIDSIYPYLMEEMYANDINTNERMAAFLAQGYVETGGLMNLKEIEGYKLASARTAFPSTLKGKSDQEVIKLLSSSESFLNFVYAAPKNGNRPGTNDGYTYLGRGFFMSTGYDKYAEMTSLTGIDFLSNPKLMAQPEYAAKSAVQFWENNNFNNYADKITGEVKVWRVGKKWNSNQPSFLDISTTINGGYMHIQDRAIAYNRIYKILTTSNVAMRPH